MAGFVSLRYVVKGWSDAAGERENELIFQRRAYHWRSLGKVLPTGPGATRGTGNSRRYNEATVPLIAVMLQISNRLSSIEELDAISRTIQRGLAGNKTPFARCWTAALVRAAAELAPQRDAAEADVATESPRENHYLTIAFPSPTQGLAVRCGPTPIFNYGVDVDVYLLDLDFIFYTLAESSLFVKSSPHVSQRRIREGG